MKRSLVVVWVVLVGCLGPRPDPSAFFLLSSTPTPAGGPSVPVVLGLGPVTLPGYLDRAQIVVRVSENEVALTETDRWAEPLRDNVARTLQVNLSTLLPNSSYVEHPWYESDAPEYGISVAIRRFEADAAGEVILETTWRITSGGSEIDGGETLIEESAGGPDRTATVAAQSRALAELSREIAAAVRRAVGHASSRSPIW